MLKEIEKTLLKLFRTCFKDVGCVYQLKFVWRRNDVMSIKNGRAVRGSGLYLLVYINGYRFFLNLEGYTTIERERFDTDGYEALKKATETKTYKKCFKEAEKFTGFFRAQNDFIESLEEREQLIEQFMLKRGYEATCWSDKEVKSFVISIFKKEDGADQFDFVLKWKNFEFVFETYHYGLSLSSSEIFEIVLFLQTLNSREV